MLRRRRSMLWFVLLAGGLLAATATGVTVAARHEPAFYRAAEVVEHPGRGECAQEFQHRAFGMVELIGQPTWAREFTQDQLNCYLHETVTKQTRGIFDIPDGIHDPRVELTEDRMRVGFRYGDGWLSTVVSVDVQLWLVAKDVNTIALELRAFRAGALPLGTHALMDYISESARNSSIDISWYRHDGNPVALLRLQADQPLPTFHLRRLELQPGKLMVAGRRVQDTVVAP